MPDDVAAFRFFGFEGTPDALVDVIIAPLSSAALRLLLCDKAGLPDRLPEGLVGLAERLFCPSGLLLRTPLTDFIFRDLGLVARWATRECPPLMFGDVARELFELIVGRGAEILDGVSAEAFPPFTKILTTASGCAIGFSSSSSSSSSSCKPVSCNHNPQKTRVTELA